MISDGITHTSASFTVKATRFLMDNKGCVCHSLLNASDVIPLASAARLMRVYFPNHCDYTLYIGYFKASVLLAGVSALQHWHDLE